MNKTTGPTGTLLFDYLAEAPTPTLSEPSEDARTANPPDVIKSSTTQPVVGDLEGAGNDPSFTKVVDRRWYERNKHIYPASVWQEFDPERDYQKEVRRDLGGNAFFYS